MGPRRCFLLLVGPVAVLGGGCRPAAPVVPDPTMPVPARPGPTPVCVSVDPAASARAFEPGCGFDLRGGAAGLQLVDLGTPTSGPWEGPPPEVCATGSCRYRLESAGARVFAVVEIPSPASEIPSVRIVGLPAGDGRLVWIDLWEAAGEAQEEGGTYAGPGHELSVWWCGDAVVLQTAPRLAGFTRVEPPASLLRRAGTFDLRGGELVPREPPVVDAAVDSAVDSAMPPPCLLLRP